MASFNLAENAKKLNIENPNYMLAKGLMQPFSASNSGSRKLMYGTQSEQNMPTVAPEVPYIGTGYETRFGENSSSFTTAGCDMTVIGMVSKFTANPRHHYFVFAADHENKMLHVFERKEYKHITESYGYLYDNDYIDSLQVGSQIKHGQAVQKSNAFDENNLRMNGVNLLSMYNACESTIEDAILISESASKKLSAPLIKPASIIINDNDIPLNLYGDSETYKIFPDIGEEVKDSIVCALRREKKEETLYSQSYARLREPSISDEKYTMSGRVVDINVYCNDPEKLKEYGYNEQLKYYYDDNMRMSAEIVNLLKPFLDQGYQMEYDLQRLFSICNGCLNGKQYFSERAFSNIILEITVMEIIPISQGDKLSNRYGGKGITSRVLPDECMPKTSTGQSIDIIFNMCGVYGRENAGQLFEVTVSYVCMKLLQAMRTRIFSVDECIDFYLTLLDIVAPSMHDYVEQLIARMSDDDVIAFIGNECDTNQRSLYLVIEPMTENMTIDKVKELYDAFPWIKPEHMYMPIKDSAGQIKYVPSRRPMVYGYQYIYRLKQYAEEKFSVTSLSATNIRNENSKSKNSNSFKALYSRTPIRFGDMETGNLIHLGAELIVQMLMLYSTSPHARRLTQEMLTGDAFNVNIKVDMESKNRNVEILNVYLKTMGLRLVFKRTPKKLEQPMLISPMMFYDNPRRLEPCMVFMHPDEKFDLDKDVERLLNNEKYEWPMLIYPMEFEE